MKQSYRIPVTLAMFALLTACTPAPQQPRDSWKLSAELAEKLGSEVHVAGGYGFFLPHSYKMLTTSQQDGGSQYIWCRDADGGGPDTATLSLIIGKKLHRKDDLSTPEFLTSLYETFGRSLSGGIKDFSLSAPELGYINKMRFIRGTWTGTRGGQNQQGNLYATVDDRTGVCFFSTLPASDEQARELMEAAILTFSKQIEQPHPDRETHGTVPY